jgi:hypothetical protein
MKKGLSIIRSSTEILFLLIGLIIGFYTLIIFFIKTKEQTIGSALISFYSGNFSYSLTNAKEVFQLLSNFDSSSITIILLGATSLFIIIRFILLFMKIRKQSN